MANHLKQIHDTYYALKYKSEEKNITLVGAGFDTKTRNMGEWLAETV